MKQIDETAGRFGRAMMHARRVCHMSTDDVALLLRMTPAELHEFERAHEKVPVYVFEHILVVAFKTMHLRVLENKYRCQRNLFRKYKAAITASE